MSKKNCKQKYGLNKSKKIQKQDDICPICIDRSSNVVIKICRHQFCRGCIKKWSKTSNQCPLCRKQFSEVISFKERDKIVLREKFLENQKGDQFQVLIPYQNLQPSHLEHIEASNHLAHESSMLQAENIGGQQEHLDNPLLIPQLGSAENAILENQSQRQQTQIYRNDDNQQGSAVFVPSNSMINQSYNENERQSNEIMGQRRSSDAQLLRYYNSFSLGTAEEIYAYFSQ